MTLTPGETNQLSSDLFRQVSNMTGINYVWNEVDDDNRRVA